MDQPDSTDSMEKQREEGQNLADGSAFDRDSEQVGGRFVYNRRQRPIPPKLYRIGEIVEYSSMSRQTIHNYTTMGLLPETRWTDGGHRLYDESVFDRLNTICELKHQGKSLEFIRTYFVDLDGR